MKRGLGHKLPPSRGATESAPPAHEPAAHVPSRPDERDAVARLNPAIPFSISVTGSNSNAGKTWICERIVESIAATHRRVAALKVTRTHVATCPRQNDHCSVCDDLDVPYELIDDLARLDVPRKDTGRYIAAGADCVRWLIVQPKHVAAGAAAAVGAIPAGHVLVAEGNSFRDFIDVDLTLMVLDPTVAPKPSALPLLARTDAFIAPASAHAALRARLGETLSPRATWITPEEIAPWVCGRLARSVP